MLLPVLRIPAAYHLGALELRAGASIPRSWPKNMDFELGLLSVSLEPETWRCGWAGEAGEMFKLHDVCGDLRFLDIDGLTKEEREVLELKVRALGLLEGSDEWKVTSAAYEILAITDGSMVNGSGRKPSEIALEVAIAAALAGQPSLHGIWWTEVWAGMRTARGGIFQSRLPALAARQVLVAAPQAILGPVHCEVPLQ